MAGPLRKVVDIVDIVGEEPVLSTIHDVLDADRKPGGQPRQDNVFRYGVVRKPAG